MATAVVDIFIRARDEATRVLGQISSQAARMEQQFTALGMALTAVGGAAAAGFGAAALRFAGFEQSMREVQAISGATQEQFDALTETAKTLGATTKFTATEAAAGMKFLAMAGMEANDIVGAMPAVLQLAAAAGLDLASSADIVTNVMAGFGMRVEDLTRANDVLVKTFTSANTNLVQLGQAMKFVGPVAASAGVSFEEVAAAVGLLGNAGIQATMAGTSLRGALTRLLDPTKENKDLMEELGLQVLDSSGRFVGFIEVIRQLEEAGATTAQLMQLFGQRAGPAMAVLIEQGHEALAQFTAELQESGGTAERIATAQLDTLQGSFTILKSAIDGVLISVGEELAPTLRDMAGVLTDAVSTWQKLPEPIRQASVRMGALTAVLTAFTGALLILIPKLVMAAEAFRALWQASLLFRGGLLAVAAAAAALVILPPIIENIKNAFTDADERAKSFEAGVKIATQTLTEFTDRDRAIARLGQTLAEVFHLLESEDPRSSLKELNNLLGQFGLGLEAVFSQKDLLLGMFEAIAQSGGTWEELQRLVSFAGLTVSDVVQMMGKDIGDFIKVLDQLGLDYPRVTQILADAGVDLKDKTVQDALRPMREEWLQYVADVVKGAPDAGLAMLALSNMHGDAAADIMKQLEEVSYTWKQNVGEDIPAAAEDAEAAIDELAMETEMATDQMVSAISKAFPTMGQSLEDWMEQLEQTANAYRNFRDNLLFILQTLVDAHVANADAIIAALYRAGPEVTQAMAQNLAAAPVDATQRILDNLGVIAAAAVADMGEDALGESELVKQAFEFLGLTGVSSLSSALAGGDITPALDYLVSTGAAQALPTASSAGQALGTTMAEAMRASLFSQISPLTQPIAFAIGQVIPVPPTPAIDVSAIRRRLQREVDQAMAAVTGGGGGGGGGGGARARTPQEQAMDAARAAESIANAIQRSVEVFEGLRGFSARVDVNALKVIADNIRTAVQIFGEGINEARLDLAEKAGEWASSAGSVVDLIGSAADDLASLEGYAGVNKQALVRFVTDVREAVDQFLAKIDTGKLDAVKAAGEWAQGAQDILSVIGEATENLSALEGYAGISYRKLTRFVTDLQIAVREFVGTIDTSNVELVEGAADWSKAAGDVISIIGGGVEQLTALEGYSGISYRRLNRFVTDLQAAVAAFLAGIDLSKLNTLERAAEWADSARSLVEIIGSAVDNLTALGEYGAISRDAMEAFVDDVVYASERLASAIDLESTAVNEAAAQWAESAQSILGAIGKGAEALEAARDVSIRAPEAVDTIVAILVDAVERFAAGVSHLDETQASAVATLASASGDLVGAITGLAGSTSEMLRFGRNVRDRLPKIADALVEAIRLFADGVDEYDEEAAEAISTMSGATKNLVDAFVAMQGDISTVNVGPFFDFVTNLLGRFGEVADQALALKGGSAEEAMEFLDNLADFLVSFGKRFGIEFAVPRPPAPPPPPSAPAESAGVIADIARALGSVEDVLSDIKDSIEGLAGTLEYLLLVTLLDFVIRFGDVLDEIDISPIEKLPDILDEVKDRLSAIQGEAEEGPPPLPEERGGTSASRSLTVNVSLRVDAVDTEGIQRVIPRLTDALVKELNRYMR